MKRNSKHFCQFWSFLRYFHLRIVNLSTTRKRKYFCLLTVSTIFYTHKMANWYGNITLSFFFRLLFVKNIFSLTRSRLRVSENIFSALFFFQFWFVHMTDTHILHQFYLRHFYWKCTQKDIFAYTYWDFWLGINENVLTMGILEALL